MRCFITASCLLVCTILSHADTVTSATSAPGVSTGTATLYNFVQDPRLKESLYPVLVKSGGDVSETGALGKINRDWEANHNTGPWFIEEQRHAGDLMEAGIALSNANLVQKSIKAVQWGLDHMQPDGSFDCADAVHSTELFLEGAARAATLLRAAKPVPNAEETVAAWAPKLKQISLWLIEKRETEIPDEWQRQLGRYNHRFFASAAGIGMTAALLDDKDLAAAAEELAKEGLAREQPGSVFPENGGFDTNYQTLSALMASRYYWVCPDSDLRRKLGNAIERALGPIIDRTGDDGVVDSKGTTRTSGQETGRNGRVKLFGYREYFQALVAADHIQPSDRLKQTIKKVIPQLEHASH